MVPLRRPDRAMNDSSTQADEHAEEIAVVSALKINRGRLTNKRRG